MFKECEMSFDWIEWFGYLSSLIVLISLTMTSIMKLRVINLIGCLAFATFAYLINSLPTMFMNLGIAMINVFYIWKMYFHEEKFKLISAMPKTEYFEHFVSTNIDEIKSIVALEDLRSANTVFYMLRDNSIAGALIGNKDEQGVLTIMLDFVTLEYRDFKLANYFYGTHTEELLQRGVNTLVTTAVTNEHKTYLTKVGFEVIDGAKGIYQKSL